MARKSGLPNVQFMRRELALMMPTYQLISDCLAGSRAVKLAKAKYLPQPNETDTSAENQARYKAYLLRAVFYNVTWRTVNALVGQIFLRSPQVDVPTGLDVLKLDANGENVTLEQIAQMVAADTLAYGRCGLLADFSTTGANGVTFADLAKGDTRPTITSYPAGDVINWRKAVRGSRTVYTLIVIREDYHLHDDGFELKTGSQYKVLRLIGADVMAADLQKQFPDTWNDDYGEAIQVATSSASDVYRMEVWRNSNASSTGYGLAQVVYPKDHAGKFLNEIPFKFIGARANDDAVDKPPIEDMAELNIAHYRNSADYEETSFLTGQPTPFVSGVTEEWNEKVLKGVVQLGSRGVIPLPNGGTAGLLQAAANSVPFEAMGQKERQMVALGAKLVEQRSVQRTATEAQMEGTADTSVLANIAKNVSAGIDWACKACCQFTGDDPNAVSFILNTEFDLTRMDPAERQQLLLEWQGGAIAFTEMRSNLRRGGVATLDDEEAQKAVDKEAAKRQANAVAVVKATAEANAKANPQPAGTKPGTPPGA